MMALNNSTEQSPNGSGNNPQCPTIWEFDVPYDQRLAFAIILLLLGVVALVVNGLLLYGLCYRNEKRTLSVTYIICLTICDMFSATVIHSLTAFVYIRVPQSCWVMKTVQSLSVGMITMSFSLTLIIAIDRYFHLRSISAKRRVVTMPVFIASLVASTAFASLYAISVIYFVELRNLILAVLIKATIICTMYFLYGKMMKRTTVLANGAGSDILKNKTDASRRRRLGRMIKMILALLLICYIPTDSVVIYVYYKKETLKEDPGGIWKSVSMWTYLTINLNSCCNALIFIFGGNASARKRIATLVKFRIYSQETTKTDSICTLR